MSWNRLSVALALGIITWAGECGMAYAQSGRSTTKAAQVNEITAEAFGKLFEAGSLDPAKPYQNKTLRITGRVAMAFEPFVYLGTGLHFSTGQPVRITLEFKDGTFPKVSSNEKVVTEGLFERQGVFGPVLTGCRIVREEAKAKSSPASRATARKGRVSGKTARKLELADQKSNDPRSVALRFDGRVSEGDMGYRPEHSSFRLRFGPGSWRGAVVGESLAWGDGNQGQDHWGIGSGEKTLSSEVFQDKEGAYFIFSVSGTDWESERIAVLFRLTLPDGRPGVATALISTR